MSFIGLYQFGLFLCARTSATEKKRQLGHRLLGCASKRLEALPATYAHCKCLAWTVNDRSDSNCFEEHFRTPKRLCTPQALPSSWKLTRTFPDDYFHCLEGWYMPRSPWLFSLSTRISPLFALPAQGSQPNEAPMRHAELGRVARSVVELCLLRSLGSPSDLLCSLCEQHAPRKHSVADSSARMF